MPNLANTVPLVAWRHVTYGTLGPSLVLWILAGCGLIAPDFKAYSGPDLPDAQVAVLDNWSDCHYCVKSVTADGRVYFRESHDGLRKNIKLRAGTFTIDYGEGST